ncbi:MAG: hypothetical protein Q4A90_09705 [Streptococcus sp.]|nr:hypothetical protein [Streptococcus sp.]
MSIKYSKVKYCLLLILACLLTFFYGIAILEDITPFRVLFFITGLVFIQWFFRRLNSQNIFITIDGQNFTYYFSGPFSRTTYVVPISQISNSRYSQDSSLSEISLWVDESFTDFARFNHPRHKIYAYEDSRLICVIFKKGRLQELENQGLNYLLFHGFENKMETTTQSQNEPTDSIFF